MDQRPTVLAKFEQAMQRVMPDAAGWHECRLELRYGDQVTHLDLTETEYQQYRATSDEPPPAA